MNETSTWMHLFGVELHLTLGLWEKLNVISSIDLLSNYSDFVSD